MTIKRLLFLTHRWFGIAMCLLFALWFASGLVMMYVEYPELTEPERLENLPALNPGRIALSLDEALARSPSREGRQAITLSSVAGRPAYLIREASGSLTTVFADDGEVLEGPTQEQVLATVAASGFVSPGAAPVYAGKIDMDQWTVSSELHEHRPLHKVELGDAAGTVLYVSDLNGQIVRDSGRRERFWNWLGSTIHWIYPMQLRRHDTLWAQVIIYLSLAGIVSVLTGGIIGSMRLGLRKRYKGNRLSPYRGVDKWHHVLGLVSLVFVATFIFSGLMSMGPWGIFDSEGSLQAQTGRFTGGLIDDPAQFPEIDWAALPGPVKEVEWRQVGGMGHLVLSASAAERTVLLGGGGDHKGADALARRIENSLARFIPSAQVASVEVLDDYDNYYYSRHNRYRPLPVYRVKFDDPEATWFHVDRRTGAVITRETDASRLGRWLYNGLHSLDFSFLIKSGPLWDVTVILLCLAGLVFSVTSVILGWRRLT